MNGLYLVIISALVFVLAYRFYGAFIAAKVLTLNQYKVTPAFRFEDGHDYVPTNKYVVFGHHFAAIAGAGPLVGPVIAAQFGYLPGALWILIGGVLAGAVHDMVILFCSMRYDGKSIAEIAKAQIGDKQVWQHPLPSCSSTSSVWPAWPSSSPTPCTTAPGVRSPSA